MKLHLLCSLLQQSQMPCPMHRGSRGVMGCSIIKYFPFLFCPFSMVFLNLHWRVLSFLQYFLFSGFLWRKCWSMKCLEMFSTVSSCCPLRCMSIIDRCSSPYSYSLLLRWFDRLCTFFRFPWFPGASSKFLDLQFMCQNGRLGSCQQFCRHNSVSDLHDLSRLFSGLQCHSLRPYFILLPRICTVPLHVTSACWIYFSLRSRRRFSQGQSAGRVTKPSYPTENVGYLWKDLFYCSLQRCSAAVHSRLAVFHFAAIQCSSFCLVSRGDASAYTPAGATFSLSNLAAEGSSWYCYSKWKQACPTVCLRIACWR